MGEPKKGYDVIVSRKKCDVEAISTRLPSCPGRGVFDEK
jgi:hypothetical protein